MRRVDAAGQPLLATLLTNGHEIRQLLRAKAAPRKPELSSTACVVSLP